MPTGKDSIHMVILETDEAHPATQQRRGSFGDVLTTTFEKAAAQHDPSLGLETSIKFVVEDKGGKVPGIEEFEHVHAVLITGSMYDAHGEDEWIMKLLGLLKALWKSRPDIRFSGICFGHQLLCRMLGSTITSTLRSTWELSYTEISLTPIGCKLFELPKGKLHLHQMHSDHVSNAPSSSSTDLLSERDRVHVWGSTETTEIQGVYIRERLFTSQAHLGFDKKMVERQIELREESGGIEEKDQAQADEAKETSGMEHDGLIVAEAVLKFFHGEFQELD